MQASDISPTGATISIAVQLTNHDSSPVAATVSCKLLDQQGNVAATLRADKHLAAKTGGETLLVTKSRSRSFGLQIRLAYIRISRNDLSFVMAELQDDAGNPIEDGVAEIQFSVKGRGELAAVGSANPHDMASYHQPHRMTFHGRCLAILRPGREKGAITLEARGDNLRSGNITIDVS